MRKLFCLLFLLLPFMAQAQTIKYTPYAFTSNGLGNSTTYSGSNQDSVWALIESGGAMNGFPVYQANRIASDGFSVTGNFGPAPQSSITPYKIVGTLITSGTQPQSGWRYELATPDITDTGLYVICTPPLDFLVTGVYIEGNNDTSGYTSNANVTVGTASGWGTPYANIVAATTHPPLGIPQTLAATVVSPRNFVPAGTPIYWHVTTGAVATVIHGKSVVVTGVFR